MSDTKDWHTGKGYLGEGDDIARVVESMDTNIRREALQKATDLVGGLSGDPDLVLEAARKFEAFLIGKVAPEQP